MLPPYTLYVRPHRLPPWPRLDPSNEEQAHVTWLRHKLLALDAEIPPVAYSPKAARNAWEALLMDLDEENRTYMGLLEAMHIAEHVDPEIAEGLRRIREEEQRHREEILDMVAKSDPYTLLRDPARGEPLGWPPIEPA
jgi:hypothetical protein